MIEAFNQTTVDICTVLDDTKQMLLEKNLKYGDNAVNPVRIFSRSSPIEQILVRIDDKLSRLSRGAGFEEVEEDAISDLIGYLVLLKVARLSESRK